MKLIEALKHVQEIPDTAPACAGFLACGFTPLHFQTFLKAISYQTAGVKLELRTGDYGDLIGNIARLAKQQFDRGFVCIEWPDLDPRLGFRSAHGWRASQFDDMRRTVVERLAELNRTLVKAAEAGIVCVSLPTLSLPPMFSSPLALGHELQFAMLASVFGFAMEIGAHDGIRVANPVNIDAVSPTQDRYSLTDDLTAGFPFTLSHASKLARLLVEVAMPSRPKKGIITDLDNTVWRGTVGEDGIDGISWHLEKHTRMHAVYQELLASLAESGILIAVASKNDSTVVDRALRRDDLVLPADRLFPLEVHWEAKSASIARILSVWNVLAEDVVFIDDNPLEIAEVSAAFPALECLQFPTTNDRGIAELMALLRNRFGKTRLTEEDSFRVHSIRAARHFREQQQADPDRLLRGLRAVLTLDWQDADARCFELINKTNQFNLNGIRWDESRWKQHLENPAAYVLSVQYQDKFGPLGKIAVVAGVRGEAAARIDAWVMSCRAFSRRIEHHVLHVLFEELGSRLLLDFQATPRNTPLRQFLSGIVGNLEDGTLMANVAQFDRVRPQLYGEVVRK